MATLSTESLAATTTGIFYPKIRNRFRVLFQAPGYDRAPQSEPALSKYDENHPLNPVSMQLVKIYIPEQDFVGNQFGLALGQSLTFEYEDDIINLATKAITDAGVVGTKFDIIIELLDGNESVLEEIKFRNCIITQSVHLDPLDYAGCPRDNVTVTFDPLSFVGKLVDDVDGGEEMMKMLNVFFSNLKATIITRNPNQPSEAVRRQVTVSFETREDVYPQKSELK